MSESAYRESYGNSGPKEKQMKSFTEERRSTNTRKKRYQPRGPCIWVQPWVYSVKQAESGDKRLRALSRGNGFVAGPRIRGSKNNITPDMLAMLRNEACAERHLINFLNEHIRDVKRYVPCWFKFHLAMGGSTSRLEKNYDKNLRKPGGGRGRRYIPSLPDDAKVLRNRSNGIETLAKVFLARSLEGRLKLYRSDRDWVKETGGRIDCRRE
jgi:hypothetical protein